MRRHAPGRYALNARGLRFLNRCNWAYCAAEVVRLLELLRERRLSREELKA